MVPLTPRLEAARAAWRWTGEARPPFADEPGPGQESVWDYPRPPALDLVERRVEVRLGGVLVAAADSAIRVLETASPPTYYLRPDHVTPGLLHSVSGSTWCEWKGSATYWDVSAPGHPPVPRGAWSYDDPYAEYDAIRGWLAFYPSRFSCTVDGVAVRPQPGGFYGGWITPDVSGPFKGEPGISG